MEACAQFQERGDAAVNLDRPLGWLNHARDQLEDGALARPILSDDADGARSRYVDRDILQGPKELVMASTAHQPAHQIEIGAMSLRVEGKTF